MKLDAKSGCGWHDSGWHDWHGGEAAKSGSGWHDSGWLGWVEPTGSVTRVEPTASAAGHLTWARADAWDWHGWQSCEDAKSGNGGWLDSDWRSGHGCEAAKSVQWSSCVAHVAICGGGVLEDVAPVAIDGGVVDGVALGAISPQTLTSLSFTLSLGVGWLALLVGSRGSLAVSSLVQVQVSRSAW